MGRQHCLSLSGAHRANPVGNDLVFKVGGKMFAVDAARAGAGMAYLQVHTRGICPNWWSGRALFPAPYWRGLIGLPIETESALPRAEVQRLLRQLTTGAGKAPEESAGQAAGGWASKEEGAWDETQRSVFAALTVLSLPNAGRREMLLKLACGNRRAGV